MKDDFGVVVNSDPGNLLEGLIPVRQAAEALGISESTAWRWINKRLLPAYRVGQKRVYVKRSDLAPLLRPARTKEEPKSTPKPREDRLSEADRKRWIKALADSKRMRDEMLAERGGRPWIPSEVLLNEARDERSEQLG